MKKNSRTKNTIYNFITSVIGQFITILMQFVVRTVFIQTLGKSYLGINGLFSNILSMLSLAELGVGSAILFKLYKPLAENDKKRINILIKFYKKVYTIIGIVITVIGISLIPFLHFIIKDYDKLTTLGINAIFIYSLYLMQSISSYLFFAYKSAIVKADQKEYKLNIVSYIFTVLTSIVQIIMLKLISNFEIYVIISVISIILQNIVNAILANKMYPFIKEKCEEKITKSEVKDIFKDCSAIFLYKINNVVLKATDNIIISGILGLEMVGMYSNYYILYTTIKSLFIKVFDSATHSLGNLHVTDKTNHEYTIFKTVNLIAVILGATGGIGIFSISNEFIKTWIGEEWMLAQPFSLLMGIEVYNLSKRIFLSRYRSAMGLFQQAKYRPVAGMIINLVVSIALVKHLGICGVLIGTLSADYLTILWYEPLIIYKYGLSGNLKVKEYFQKNIIYGITACLIGITMFLTCKYILPEHGWLSIILHTSICSTVTPLVFITLFSNTEEVKYIKMFLNKILKKVSKNKGA